MCVPTRLAGVQPPGNLLPKQPVTITVPFLLLGISCLGGEWAGHVYIFTLSPWLTCSCFSVFQSRQLFEVGAEAGELGRSMCKAALPSLEDCEDCSTSLALLSSFPSLGWQRWTI